LRELSNELDDVMRRLSVIVAKHRKDILSDGSLDKVGYNERPKLLEAELILRLEVDPAYQATMKRERELALEEDELEMEKSLMVEEIFGKLPPRGLYEDDSDLDNP
jgi:hypothetical protein